MKLILTLGIVLFSAVPVLAVDLKNEDSVQHTVKITEQTGTREETLEPNEEKTVCAGACQLDVENIGSINATGTEVITIKEGSLNFEAPESV